MISLEELLKFAAQLRESENKKLYTPKNLINMEKCHEENYVGSTANMWNKSQRPNVK